MAPSTVFRSKSSCWTPTILKEGVHCFHLLLLTLLSAHHSIKGVSFFPSSQSGFNPLRQWSDSASLSAMFQYPLWVPSDHILEEAIFILPRESSADSSLLKDTRHRSQEGLPYAPDHIIFPTPAPPSVKWQKLPPSQVRCHP